MRLRVCTCDCVQQHPAKRIGPFVQPAAYYQYQVPTMRNNCHFALLVAFCSFYSLLAPVRSQNIETVPSSPSYHTLYDRNVDLLCRADKPIDQCQVRIPGPSSEVFDVGRLPSGVKHIGDGSRGECGVRLSTITSERFGKFVCILVINGEMYEGAIEVRQNVSPRPTELKISKYTALVDGGIRANQSLKARCISRHGLPVSNLTWYLNNKPIDESLLKPPQITSEMQNGKSLQTIQQEVNLYVTPEQNGMVLECVVNHPAFRTEQRTSFPLNIKFAPEAIPHIHIDELPATGSAMVNITIHANPQPITRWTVNGRLIKEGESLDIYQAYIPRLTSANGEYTVLLKNNDCSKERATLFTLEATNVLGTQTYIIKAVRVDDAGTVVIRNDDYGYNDDSNGSTFWLISVWTFFCSVMATRLL